MANASRYFHFRLQIHFSFRLLNLFSKFWYLRIAENVLFQKDLAYKVIRGRQPGGNRVATFFCLNLQIWTPDPESRPRATTTAQCPGAPTATPAPGECTAYCGSDGQCSVFCECEPDCESEGQCGGADDGCGGTCDEACPVCSATPVTRPVEREQSDV